MHSVRVPFIHWRMVGQGVTNWNKIERDYVVGQIED